MTNRSVAIGTVVAVVTIAGGIVMDYQPAKRGPVKDKGGIIQPCIWPKCSKAPILDVKLVNLN